MKILFFTKYSEKGASSRYRVYQYLDYFKSQAIKVDVFPLLEDKYLDDLYAHKRGPKLYLISLFVKRLIKIFYAGSYDLVVIQKELFPYLPPVFEYLLYLFNKNIIFDFDDAIFLYYQHKLFLKSKIPTTIRLSKAVTVGNSYLAKYAMKFNKNVIVVPTTIDVNKYKPKLNHKIKKNSPIVIGWIGTPITARFLEVVKESLLLLSKKYDIILRCVGTPKDFSINGINVENVKWEVSTEVKTLQSFDIGIMPLTDEPVSKGKCGLKLLQYMAMGIPSVASPVGVNRDIIRDGVNGFLASSTEEWVKKISLLIENEKLYRDISENARSTVEQNFSLEKWASKLIKIFRQFSDKGKEEPKNN